MWPISLKANGGLVASLTAGRLSYLDFLNNPVSKQFLHGKGGWPKTLPGPREITASVSFRGGANAHLVRGGRPKFLQCTFRSLNLVVCLSKILCGRERHAGKMLSGKRCVHGWGRCNTGHAFGLAMLVVLLSLPSVLWLLGGACKLAAMVEAKKPIVFTSGRLGTCFTKKIFFVRPKEIGLAAGCL
jgi:hypothetical protein